MTAGWKTRIEEDNKEIQRMVLQRKQTIQMAEHANADRERNIEARQKDVLRAARYVAKQKAALKQEAVALEKEAERLGKIKSNMMKRLDPHPNSSK